MRRLHPVGPREKFLQRGEYLRYPDDVVVEQWTLHQVDEGYFIRVDRSEQAGFALYEALLDADGLLVRLNEEQFRPDAVRMRRHMLFVEQAMQTTTSRDDEIAYDEREIPLGVVCFALSWPFVLQGWALQTALRLNRHLWHLGDGTTLMPQVTEHQNGLRIVNVAGFRFWLDANNMAVAVQTASRERYYLKDTSGQSRLYAAVE